MYGWVELIEDYILQRRSFAKHLGLPSGSAGPAHLRYAIVDFQITICFFSFTLTVIQ
ncbi:hypothetical protein ES707_21476 [subsurface metagenome]